MDGVERVMVLGIFAVIVAILSIAAWGVTSHEGELAADVADGGMSVQAPAVVIASDGSRVERAPPRVGAKTQDGTERASGGDLAQGIEGEAGRRAGRSGAGPLAPNGPLAGVNGAGRPISLSSVSPVGSSGSRPELLDPGQPLSGPGHPVPVESVPAKVEAPAVVQYKVVKGDTLWGIARRHFGEGDTKAQVQLIQQMNPGLDVATIREGDVLRMPSDAPKSVVSKPVTQAAKAGTVLYTIQAGDSLRGIASARLGGEGRWREIYELNRSTIADPEKIHAGMTILVPEK